MYGDDSKWISELCVHESQKQKLSTFSAKVSNERVKSTQSQITDNNGQ